MFSNWHHVWLQVSALLNVSLYIICYFYILLCISSNFTTVSRIFCYCCVYNVFWKGLLCYHVWCICLIITGNFLWIDKQSQLIFLIMIACSSCPVLFVYTLVSEKSKLNTCTTEMWNMNKSCPNVVHLILKYSLKYTLCRHGRDHGQMLYFLHFRNLFRDSLTSSFQFLHVGWWRHGLACLWKHCWKGVRSGTHAPLFNLFIFSSSTGHRFCWHS